LPANAIAESAKVKMNPPWHRPWPFTIASVTRIVRRA